MLILSQPAFLLIPLWCVLSGEIGNVYGLMRLWLEHTIYLTRVDHANNYTSDAAFVRLK
jgi:hypothetical protein